MEKVKIFGGYLRQAREEAGLKQKDVAAKLSKLTHKEISQGVIAQYEGGGIRLPDPKLLKLLARVYKRDYRELMFRAILDIGVKYEKEDTGPASKLTPLRFELLETELTRFPLVGDVEGLEESMLRSKIAFLKDAEILDVQGLAEWQTKFENLSEYWVVTPRFVDLDNDNIREAVIFNLRRDVKYVYFVRATDTDEDGKFLVLKNTLARIAPDIKEKIIHLVRSVVIPEAYLKWINTDIVIANPMSKKPIGFSSIRRQGMPLYGIRMTDVDAANLVDRISSFAAEATGGDTGATVTSIARGSSKSSSNS